LNSSFLLLIRLRLKAIVGFPSLRLRAFFGSLRNLFTLRAIP
jgi:hypothetical protein